MPPATPAPAAERQPLPASAGGLPWGLHVLGFDEWIPAPSRADAEAACAAVNARLAALLHLEGRARLRAQVEPWPFGLQQHRQQLQGFADLVAELGR